MDLVHLALAMLSVLLGTLQGMAIDNDPVGSVRSIGNKTLSPPQVLSPFTVLSVFFQCLGFQVPGGSLKPKNNFEETKRVLTRHGGEMTNQKKCILVTGILVTATFLAGYFLNTSYEHVYAIIIDAGSTGTRLNAFNFQKSYLSGHYTLVKDLFVEVKPGLSSYADNPQKGAATVIHLLLQSNLHNVIPTTEWKRTPLALRATAGLRLLPGHQADDILKEVRRTFADLPFYTNERSVSIMDGSDEGIFSWFTINFLSDRLGGPVDDMAAALDLGGGSTQVTFATLNDSHIWETSSQYLHPITVFHKNFYLGLGLMAARKAILQHGNPEGETHLKTPCMHHILSKEWHYRGVTYTVSGLKSQEPGHNKETVCAGIVKNYIRETVKAKPDKLHELKRIHAFSYYFDRAAEYGHIDPFEGGVVQVRLFGEAAAASCVHPNVDQPFMCLDMTFIHLLLTEAFGLKARSSMHLYKKIDHHEISWALGAAFHVIQNGL